MESLHEKSVFWGPKQVVKGLQSKKCTSMTPPKVVFSLR